MAQRSEHRADVFVERLLSLQSDRRALVNEHENEGLVGVTKVLVDYLEVVVVRMDNMLILVVQLHELISRLLLFRCAFFSVALELTLKVEKQSVLTSFVTHSLDHVLGLDLCELGITLANVLCKLFKR